MTLKELKRKLEIINPDYDDFEITVDAGDYNLLTLERVTVGANWNILLSCDPDEEDIEDDSSMSVHRKP